MESTGLAGDIEVKMRVEVDVRLVFVMTVKPCVLKRVVHVITGHDQRTVKSKHVLSVFLVKINVYFRLFLCVTPKLSHSQVRQKV